MIGVIGTRDVDIAPGPNVTLIPQIGDEQGFSSWATVSKRHQAILSLEKKVLESRSFESRLRASQNHVQKLLELREVTFL